MKRKWGRRRKEKKEKELYPRLKRTISKERKNKTKTISKTEDKCFSSLDSKMAVRASYIRNLTGGKKKVFLVDATHFIPHES